MAIFTKVVEAGSFSKAGAALGLGKSVISQHVLTLETGLGAQLINRSPRSLSLTEEGRRFYEACLRMMEQADAAFSSLHQLQAEPRGTLRISASYNLGLTFLIAEISEYLRRHSHVQVELVLEDAIVNVIEEGFDLCLRVGWLKDTRLHAVRFGTFRLIPCASAAYLARHAAPRDPSELATIPWVSITQLPHPDRLEFVKNDRQRRSVKVTPSVKTNTGIAAKEFVLNGDFVGLLPDYAILDDLREGRLVRLLPEWSTREGTISAVFPHKEHMTPRLRLLLDHLRAAFQRHYGRTPAAYNQVRPVLTDAVSSKTVSGSSG